MRKTTVRGALVVAVALSTTPAVAQADTDDAAQPGLTNDQSTGGAEQPAQPDTKEEKPAPAPDVSNDVQPGLGENVTPEVEGVQPGTVAGQPAPAADGAETQPGTSPAVAGGVEGKGKATADHDVQPGTAIPEAELETQPGTTPPAPVQPEVPAGEKQPADETTTDANADTVVTDEIVDTPPADHGTNQPVLTPAVNDTPARPAPAADQVRRTDTPKRESAPTPADAPAVQPAPTTGESNGATPQQPVVDNVPTRTPAPAPAPAAPVQPTQPAAKPEPQILRQGAITANIGAVSAEANYVTLPGETVVNASVNTGRATVHAPTMAYGTYNHGVAELGVGTNKPAPVKLDPVTTAIVDVANNAVRHTPQPVREATKLPTAGDYRVGSPAAGAHIAWKS